MGNRDLLREDSSTEIVLRTDNLIVSNLLPFNSLVSCGIVIVDEVIFHLYGLILVQFLLTSHGFV